MPDRIWRPAMSPFQGIFDKEGKFAKKGPSPNYPAGRRDSGFEKGGSSAIGCGASTPAAAREDMSSVFHLGKHLMD